MVVSTTSSSSAVFGQPDFTQLVWTVNGSEIRYGAFLTVIVNFLLLALVLFGLVTLLKRVGLGNFRAQGSHECPYCKEFAGEAVDDRGEGGSDDEPQCQVEHVPAERECPVNSPHRPFTTTPLSVPVAARRASSREPVNRDNDLR